MADTKEDKRLDTNKLGEDGARPRTHSLGAGRDLIQQLVDRPTENLSIELKSWFDPDSEEGVRKIVRALFALRNHGGGYLLIGFGDKSGDPLVASAPPKPRAVFSADKIQGIVGKYASEPFEVEVHFGERKGHEYPVIAVPAGVTTPVAVRADLAGQGGKRVLRENQVFVRSLNANNTASSAEATWRDWERILKVCYDNRDADVGRFIRRHLAGMKAEHVRVLLDSVRAALVPETTLNERCRAFREHGESRFQTVVAERNLSFPPHGSWEVAAVLEGESPDHSTTKEFLNLLDSSNPSHTGWPPWLDSRGFRDTTAAPFVWQGGWEALIVSLPGFLSDHLDYWRVEPAGRFYLRRALEDDLPSGRTKPGPLTSFDFVLPVLRTAEAIAVILAFGNAMKFKAEQSRVAFTFRWTKLKDRELSAWANPERLMPHGRKAYQDMVESEIIVPLDLSPSALPATVQQVIQPLHQVFGGFELGLTAVENLVGRLLARRL